MESSPTNWTDSIVQAIAILRSEAMTYPVGVRVWMRCMIGVFGLGAIFAPKKIEARIVLATMLATAGSLIVAKLVWPNVARASAGSAMHIVLWLPLLAYLAFRRRSTIIRTMETGKWFDRIFGVWVGLVVFVLVVSLVFDFRAMAIWFAN